MSPRFVIQFLCVQNTVTRWFVRIYTVLIILIKMCLHVKIDQVLIRLISPCISGKHLNFCEGCYISFQKQKVGISFLNEIESSSFSSLKSWKLMSRKCKNKIEAKREISIFLHGTFWIDAFKHESTEVGSRICPAWILGPPAVTPTKKLKFP